MSVQDVLLMLSSELSLLTPWTDVICKGGIIQNMQRITQDIRQSGIAMAADTTGISNRGERFQNGVSSLLEEC